MPQEPNQSCTPCGRAKVIPLAHILVADCCPCCLQVLKKTGNLLLLVRFLSLQNFPSGCSLRNQALLA